MPQNTGEVKSINPLSDLERLIRLIRRGGLRPDMPDIRDWLIGRAIPRGLVLPSEVDQRPHESPVEDQGTLGSCTAQAGIGALEYLDRIPDGEHADLSALALYYWEREAMGTVGEDSGASLRECVKQLAKGVCRLGLCPYAEEKFAEAPGLEAVADRANHRAGEYYRIGPVNRSYHVKAALASGFAVIGGIAVYESMMTEKVAKTGVVPLPKFGDSLIGGHAVKLSGYSDLSGTYVFRNSWGQQWGDKGYGTLPQRYVANPLLFSDVWAVKKLAVLA
ncbi:MAG TPA: C1 family peptidase [Kiritimatiellia bacterium]|nr:C1 family peptidase [Kiritimatiellia bacterium]